jgi:hypothetical protein
MVMLFGRQRLLLSLLDSLGDSVAAIDFQKLLFLFTHEFEDSPSYEFVPYKFGCFSFTSYADKRKLVAKGLLADDETRWRLTKDGRAEARKRHELEEALSAFNERYTGLHGDELVRNVYKRYPYYAIRSEVVDRVVKSQADRKRIESARPVKSGPGLATIGYEGKSIEKYLNQLIETGVTLLCDVRRNPLSRKYGFSKKSLSNTCLGVGVRYEHLPELGIPSGKRRVLKSQEDYDRLLSAYKRNSLPGQNSTLQKIAKWVDADRNFVALTCFELDSNRCHRSCVGDAVAKMCDQPRTVCHL